ncbi:Putative DNA-invertase from lambdoid prophage Rac [Clostridioides difficile]|jgi:DNA invertase Pin-like site-specific DNA recombinase|nr:Putative DNA-invertase from lambdoid prophage Rac [Clostridioides difficile]
MRGYDFMIFSYMRISTQKEKQTTDRQRITLEQYAKENKFKFDEIIEERISGTIKAEHRPQFNILKQKLRENDILIITDIDRLGRNADDVIMEFKKLKSEGIRIIALDTPYLNEWEKIQDSSIYNMIADIFITLKAHMAVQEREKTISRINQGLMVAREKGKTLGRPKAELPKDFIKEYKKFKDGDYGDMSAMSFAKMLGIGRSTLYKYINIFEGQEVVG